jgi:hypothetical protein
MRWDEAEEAQLKALWQQHKGALRPIALAMNTTRNSILGKSRRLNLQFHRGEPINLTPSHDAVKNGRTMFRHQVVEPDANVLKPGNYQRKLGGIVEKGKWKGMPIFSLTLEERATCPTTCVVYSSCYGNSMPRSKRYKHGELLYARLYNQLEELNATYPRGFVVRLHILGDFFDKTYVEFWRLALREYRALRIFGYTAWKVRTPIGSAIWRVRHAHPNRFMIRVSGTVEGFRSNVIDRPEDAGDAIICPVETGKTRSCASCALCWSTKKPIAFLRH